MYSDASGSWGCGAFILGSAEWLQLPWPASWLAIPIAAKELVPIVASLAVWGSSWSGGTVQVYCDNMAVVQCLRAGSARDPLLNHLLRVLALLLVRLQVSLRADHIPGLRNNGADALSRDNAVLFFSLFPQAPRYPTVVPESVSDVLLDREGSWTSKAWLGKLGLCLSTSSSRSTYGAGKRRYLLFCARANLSPLPATEETLCRFMAHLAREGLRAQSISGYLSAVCHLSIEAGFTPRAREECPRLCYVLRGVSRSQAAAARPRRLPITPQILLSLKEVWERGTVDTYSARLL